VDGTLYGHVEARHPPWEFRPSVAPRQRGLDRVRQLADFDVLMAQGTNMGRDDLVAYTLDRLGRAAPPQIRPA
jgi:hypothetical protein